MATKKPKSHLNGSVNALASALRNVFTEATEQAIMPVREHLEQIETDLVDVLDGQDGLKDQIETLTSNTQAQLREVNKRIKELE